MWSACEDSEGNSEEALDYCDPSGRIRCVRPKTTNVMTSELCLDHATHKVGSSIQHVSEI